MSDPSDFGAAELHTLAADIDNIDRETFPNLRKATEVTARHVKDSWRDRLVGSETIPAGAAAITYDIEGGLGLRGGSIRADIGPEPGRSQSTIVGITETGTPKIAPRGFGLAALEENAADFERGIEIAQEQALRRLGL